MVGGGGCGEDCSEVGAEGGVTGDGSGNWGSKSKILAGGGCAVMDDFVGGTSVDTGAGLWVGL